MRPASAHTMCGDAPKRAAVVVVGAPVTGHVAKVAALWSASFVFEIHLCGMDVKVRLFTSILLLFLYVILLV
jgi:hypothetical protein